MPTVDRFEDLLIWQEAKAMSLKVYRMFKESRDFGFKDQIQRASVSVMNNIAEGFERESDADFIRFLIIAKSSSGELRSMLQLAKELEYIEKEECDNMIFQARKMGGSIGNMIKYLRNSPKV